MSTIKRLNEFETQVAKTWTIDTHDSRRYFISDGNREEQDDLASIRLAVEMRKALPLFLALYKAAKGVDNSISITPNTDKGDDEMCALTRAIADLEEGEG